jgi:membrane protease YdiL (CAAX protease family)
MLLVAWAGGWPPRDVLLIVAINTALVAVSEELMFRAILLHGLLQRLKVWPAVLAGSLLFGLAHSVNGLATGDVSGALWQSAAAFLQGICYAAIRLRTRSVWPMVVVHGVWDFALVTATLSASAEGEASILPYAALLAVLPLCLYGVYLLRPGQRA